MENLFKGQGIGRWDNIYNGVLHLRYPQRGGYSPILVLFFGGFFLLLVGISCYKHMGVFVGGQSREDSFHCKALFLFCMSEPFLIF